MKFQKGLLDDLQQPRTDIQKENARPKANVRLPLRTDDDRLFQTHRRAGRSWRQYLIFLGVVSVFVVIAGGALFYFTLPRFGDKVRAPKGLENSIRAHFIDVEKRSAGDIAFYFCESYYWARVEVERRPDIKTNALYQIGAYTARATGNSESGWNVTARPLTSDKDEVPCR